MGVPGCHYPISESCKYDLACRTSSDDDIVTYVTEIRSGCAIHVIPPAWTSCPFCARASERLYAELVVGRWRRAPERLVERAANGDEEARLERNASCYARTRRRIGGGRSTSGG